MTKEELSYPLNTQSVVSEPVASTLCGGLLEMQNLRPAPDSRFWIRICILTQPQVIHMQMKVWEALIYICLLSWFRIVSPPVFSKAHPVICPLLLYYIFFSTGSFPSAYKQPKVSLNLDNTSLQLYSTVFTFPFISKLRKKNDLFSQSPFPFLLLMT